jgi:3-oxoacyl-ACP reductase-like protein
LSIFGKIKDAIFGGRGPLSGNYIGKDERPAAAPQAPSPAPAPAQAHPAPAPAQAPQAAQPGAPVAAPQQQQPVDVEAVLEQRAAQHGGTLDWRHSIVDLMKLLDLDSSLDNRKELATELGYTGEKNGSAEMNIWLHKAVMRALAQNGGKVPAGLAD